MIGTARRKVIVVTIGLLTVFIAVFPEIASGISCWQCSHVKTRRQCKKEGSLVQCNGAEDMCHIELRHGGWGKNIMIRKSCQSREACMNNYLQNFRVSGGQQQCVGKPPSSVCTCCCSSNRCNVNQWKCSPGVLRKCAALTRPNHGTMDCKYGLQPLGICTFSCSRGYVISGGNSLLTCGHYGEWDYPQPICRATKCSFMMKPPSNGRMRCTSGNNIGSRCIFWCIKGYWLDGPQQLQCIENSFNKDAVWSQRPPACRPIQCPLTFVPFYHGSYSCSNGEAFSSQCWFKCDSDLGYKLNPPVANITCTDDSTWSAKPCCTLPCPPFAVLDIVILLDSSISIGQKKFEDLKSFVASLISHFIVRDDAARFSIFRYNRRVDTNTQILLRDYPNQQSAILNALMEITYDAEGGEETNTGSALNYTADVILQYYNGNRKEAGDVILIITDGQSRDDVAIPAKKLRDMDVELYLLPIHSPFGTINTTWTKLIVEDESHIFRDTLLGEFGIIDKFYAAIQLTNTFCALPSCINPFHNHTKTVG